MVNLSEFLTRRRWLVLAAWIAVVALAMPLASKQTDDLISGGFEVPGVQSQIVEDALADDFDPAQSGGMGVVLSAEPEATPAEIDAGVARVRTAVAEQGDAAMTPQAAAAARAGLLSEGVAVVPLTSSIPASGLTDVAMDLREEIELGVPDEGVTTYLSGQPAAYAGLQELSREDLEQAEVIGFPIVALILLAVLGSAAAAPLSSSARTISSAALIMTAVFMVFVLTGVPSIKELGFGTAVAIALDATIVRLIMVPAAMQLLGTWNWWLPGWLDRLLPDLELEGGSDRRDGSAAEPAQA